jgi:hypothetical protein
MLFALRIDPSRYPQAGGYDSCTRPPRSDVLFKCACARRFLARLASGTFLTGLKYKIFQQSLRHQAGFTLLEAAIAMSLLVLITTVLYGGFYLSHRAMESWQAHAEKSQRLRSAEDFLGSYIRSAYPYRLTLRDQGVVFSGEESRLTFVSAISVGMGGRGLAKVSLYWESDQDGTGSLVLEEEIPMRWESIEDAAGHRNKMELHQGVKSLRFHYLEPQSEEERWVEEWNGEEKRVLPRAIRISLEDRGGKEVDWLFPIMISILTP